MKEVLAPPFLLNQMAAPVCLFDLSLQDAFAVQTGAEGQDFNFMILSLTFSLSSIFQIQ